MKLFILGCGFVGSKLAQFFKSKGALVTVTTTSPEKVKDLESIASQVLLLDKTKKLEEYLTHQDVLIVCAAPKSIDLYEEAFLETAQRVQKALENNTYVKQLIYTSSCSVYGEKEGNWVDENQSLEPSNESQKILVETEKIYLNHLPTSIKTCIFRLGEIYGLEKDIEFKIKRLVESKRAVHGQNYTNLIHVEDIVRAVDFAHKKDLLGVYNLCNDSHLTRREFYDKWCQYLNLDALNFSAHSQSIHRGNKRVSNQKIKLSGFEFEHPYAEPLKLDNS